jgi:SNF2 family DNA or RNA helicase
MIKLTKQGGRLVTPNTFPGSSGIPGAYVRLDGCLTFPGDLETLHILLELLGDDVQLSGGLRSWAHTIRTNRRAAIKQAGAKDARLPILREQAPTLYRAMMTRKYQRVGARFVADNPATLVADEPGLGKTLIAMGGIIESETDGPYLVVAPKTASETVWKREIERWLPPHHKAITFPDSRAKRERVFHEAVMDEHTWVITHPEMVCVKNEIVRVEKSSGDSVTTHVFVPTYPEFFGIEWGAIVVDESHECLIRRSGRSTQRRLGLERLPLRTSGLRIAMSGTPFNSKPHQLWGTLNWLDPKTYPAFNRWSSLYWQKGGYTGFELGEFRADREQLLWDSLSALALRRTKAEVAKDLPPKIMCGTPLDGPNSPIGVWLPLAGKQLRAYTELETEFETQLDSGALRAVSALDLLTRLKQLSCAYGRIDTLITDREVKYKYTPELPSNKLDWIIQNMEDWGFPNPKTKLVVVSFYTGILECFQQAIEKHFRTKKPLTAIISGRTPMRHRKGIIDRFNAKGNERLLFLNVRAGGTAITLDSADRMVFISETRIPDQQSQAEDRIHRVSKPRNCEYYYLRSLGTVDEGTALINQELATASGRLLDTRRGIDYARRVIHLTKKSQSRNVTTPVRKRNNGCHTP